MNYKRILAATTRTFRLCAIQHCGVQIVHCTIHKGTYLLIEYQLQSPRRYKDQINPKVCQLKHNLFISMQQLNLKSIPPKYTT
jgi:hypothetical protein